MASGEARLEIVYAPQGVPVGLNPAFPPFLFSGCLKIDAKEVITA